MREALLHLRIWRAATVPCWLVRLGSIQIKAEASTARADHCITQACCFLSLTTDIKPVGVRRCQFAEKEVARQSERAPKREGRSTSRDKYKINKQV